ncbi:MAG: sulfite exporter TauE/SafE family protein [Candidatus Heimdallarchaeota archaeon]|nr:sulfite exporter TauE/SafE family protein [Candidatus Heimdallarchaeota archaeon]MCK4877675.1 sulfite exporter TauE/SafE family protein [Candidatus Heimdallarchaeota archaeon]
MSTPTILAIIAIVAFLVGIVSVIAGFGGGVFLVPFIFVLFDYEFNIIVGSTLLAVIVFSIVGVLGAWRRKEIDYKLAIIFAIPASIGALVGSLVSDRVPELALMIIVCVIAALLSYRMIKHALKDEFALKVSKGKTLSERITNFKPTFIIHHKNYSFKVSIPTIIISGLVIGLLTGLVGMSGGWLQTPLLILGFGLPPLIASGTSLLIILIKTTVGGVTHVIEGHIDWFLFLSLAISLPLGAGIGTWLKGKIKGKQISLLTGILLLIIALFLVIYYIIPLF